MTPLYPGLVYPSESLYPAESGPPPLSAPTGFDGIPKLRMPLRAQGGRLAIVEQDSPDNIAGAVFAVLSYEIGSRIEDPDFGVEDPTFEELPLDTSEWLDAINRYEPRAEVQTSQDVEELLGDVLAEVKAS